MVCLVSEEIGRKLTVVTCCQNSVGVADEYVDWVSWNYVVAFCRLKGFI